MVERRQTSEETTMHTATPTNTTPRRNGLRAKLALCAAGLAVVAASAFAASPALAGNPIKEFKAAPITVSGGLETQAGGHPNLLFKVRFGSRLDQHSPCNCSDGRAILGHLPTGFIGNPHAVPTCALAEFSKNECPIASQVGFVDLPLAELLNIGGIAVYNIEPHPGEAGLLGFYIPLLEGAAFISLSARTESDYGLDSFASGFPHVLPASGVGLHLWGVPADPSHDNLRRVFHPSLESGAVCLVEGGEELPEEEVECGTGVHSDAPLSPFLENPTTCGVPLTASTEVFSYEGGTEFAETSWPATTGCQQLVFNPSLTAQPTTGGADSASGLDVDLSVPQTQSASVPSPSELRATTLTLPEGFSINPNAADGKTSCTETEASFGTKNAAHCPENSKVGTLEIDSSALPGPIPGAIYLGQPQPGNKYRLFLTADGFGTHVKLAGSVHPNAQTGQLVVTFKKQPGQETEAEEGLPQTPLQDFKFHFFGSERGLLATPTQCGSYPVKTEFEPWDTILQNQTSISSFTIDSGPNGAPCPGSPRPFNPGLVAGNGDNTAGAHTPFTLLLTRADGDQNLAALNVTTPPGFAATLKGIPYCPESALSTLANPSYSGVTEQLRPACPAASQIGTAGAQTGAGTHPLNSPGKVYLAGPYKGAPLSLEVVVPAVSGPYDLGNVVVRSAVFVNPATAQVSTVSDHITEVLDGIPLRIRSVLINLDRHDFTLNPTNCDPFAVDATVFGNEGGVANSSAGFQVANCANLGFAPKLKLQLSGSTKRRGHPAIHAVVTAKPGEANMKRVVTALPKGELVDNSHIGTVCTKPQFREGKCPAGSLMGSAMAVTPLLDKPLEGPVYLRSSNHKLPDLALDLHGQINLEVIGRIDSPKGSGLRASFESIPDAPVTKFVLNTLGGKRGLLVNSTSLCKTTQTAQVTMVGQNGAKTEGPKKLQTGCGSKARHKRHKRARKVR
jgi:hypothetical protein